MTKEEKIKLNKIIDFKKELIERIEKWKIYYMLFSGFYWYKQNLRVWQVGY